ncbi:MAG: CDP-alcohol phosphatidyltransferase family protein [Alphaproteobacteria bacterium]
MNLPNVISLGRLLSTPVVIWLILTDAVVWAFWAFSMAAMSDAIDGFIAKRFDSATILGAYLDALADKALLASVYVVLGAVGQLPLWLVLLVVFRDLLIVGGALLLWLLTRSFRIKPLMVSKVNTVAQIILAMMVLGRLGFGVTVEGAEIIQIYVVAAAALVSGASYMMGWMRIIGQAEIKQ